MTRRCHARRQSRQALLWRVFYGSGELVGQGSIVDVHKNGCRISGRMPVEVGSHLVFVSGRQTIRPISLWRREPFAGPVDLNSDCSWTPTCRTSMNLRASLHRSLGRMLLAQDFRRLRTFPTSL